MIRYTLFYKKVPDKFGDTCICLFGRWTLFGITVVCRQLTSP